jgi:hypothetical protein
MSYQPTVGAAARGDIPEAAARALAVRLAPDGQHAMVLLDTGSDAEVYEYQVLCERKADGRVEPAGGNGPGWTSTTTGDDTQPNRGVLTDWGLAPPEAEVALVRFAGGESRHPVAHGYYFFAARDVPADSSEIPMLIRFEP